MKYNLDNSMDVQRAEMTCNDPQSLREKEGEY